MVDSALILKFGGGFLAAGSVGGVGYYGYTQKWFSADDSIALITQVTNVDNQSTANLYNNGVKNYFCKFGETGKEEKINCEILHDLTLSSSNSKKWINFSSVNLKNQNQALIVGKIQKNSFFSIKIESKFYEKIQKILEDTATNTQKIIVEPITPAATGENKKFGEFKIIAGRQHDKAIGKFQKFLGKATVPNAATNATGSKCEIGEKIKDKTCSIDIFSDTQTSMDGTKDYQELTYKGSESALGTSTALVENNYYVIKFTDTKDKFSYSDFENQNLVYIDASVSNTPKKVIFEKNNPVIVYPESNDSNKILIIL